MNQFSVADMYLFQIGHPLRRRQLPPLFVGETANPIPISALAVSFSGCSVKVQRNIKKSGLNPTFVTSKEDEVDKVNVPALALTNSGPPNAM